MGVYAGGDKQLDLMVYTKYAVLSTTPSAIMCESLI